jgi:hypothetical protein
MALVVAVQPSIGPGEAEAYRRLPSVEPPWSILIWPMPMWVRHVIFWVTTALGSTYGLITAWLVRPKNRAADVATGAIMGLIASVTAFTLSMGWALVIQTTVWPVQHDLALLSEAAWAGPAPQENPPDPAGRAQLAAADRLLEKYPDLREVPAGERGRVLYHKVRADLIDGIPRGIWLGVLFILVCGVSVGAAHVMIAGPLLRRPGPRRAVLVRFFEPAFLITVLACLAFGVVLEFKYLRPEIWHLSQFGLLVLALVSALRRWSWPLRLLLNAGWLFSAVMLARRFY